MSRMFAATAFAVLMVSSSIAVAREADPGKIVSFNQEKILADVNGHTLYTYDKDKPGKSECIAVCAAIWPPYIAPDGAAAVGHWSLVSRYDGVKQWAYDGSPVYTYRPDLKPGDTFGDGIEGTWHVIRR